MMFMPRLTIDVRPNNHGGGCSKKYEDDEVRIISGSWIGIHFKDTGIDYIDDNEFLRKLIDKKHWAEIKTIAYAGVFKWFEQHPDEFRSWVAALIKTAVEEGKWEKCQELHSVLMVKRM